MSDQKRRPWYRRVWVWILCAVVLLGVAVRVLLDPVAAHFARRGLGQLKGYRGDFEGLHISIHSLSTTVTHFKLVAEDAVGGQPAVLYAEAVEAHLLWSEVLKLRLDGQAQVRKAKVTLWFDPNAPAARGEKKPAAEPNLPDFAAILQSLVPFRVDRVELRDCEVLVVDTGDAGRPQVWLHDIESTLENVTDRRHLEKGQAATVTLKATLQHTGKVTVFVTADPLQHTPTFAGQVELKGLELSDFFLFFKDKADLQATGKLDFFASFKAEHGAVHGGLKPVLKHAEVRPVSGTLVDQIKAKVADSAIKTLSDRVPGRDAVAAIVPITGRLDAPDIQLWPAVLSVLRNAFVDGISSGFTQTPPPEAAKPEGAIKQASDALSKNGGVKTQPSAKGGTK